MAATQMLVTSKDPEKLKELARRIYEKDGTLQEALLAAGYSESSARQGMTVVPRIVHKMIGELHLADGKQFIEVGRALGVQDAENLIAGRLAVNAIQGESRGNEAAKMLGSMKRIGAFEKDSMTGVVILAAPGSVVAGKKLDTADDYDLGDTIEAENIPSK